RLREAILGMVVSLVLLSLVALGWFRAFQNAKDNEGLTQQIGSAEGELRLLRNALELPAGRVAKIDELTNARAMVFIPRPPFGHNSAPQLAVAVGNTVQLWRGTRPAQAWQPAPRTRSRQWSLGHDVTALVASPNGRYLAAVAGHGVVVRHVDN